MILLGGLEYSNALTQWLAYAPVDPTGNLGAAWHIYSNNACVADTCWDMAPEMVAATVPLVATEIGESDCMGGFITQVMNWLDGQHVGLPRLVMERVRHLRSGDQDHGWKSLVADLELQHRRPQQRLRQHVLPARHRVVAGLSRRPICASAPPSHGAAAASAAPASAGVEQAPPRPCSVTVT